VTGLGCRNQRVSISLQQEAAGYSFSCCCLHCFHVSGVWEFGAEGKLLSRERHESYSWAIIPVKFKKIKTGTMLNEVLLSGLVKPFNLANIVCRKVFQHLSKRGINDLHGSCAVPGATDVTIVNVVISPEPRIINDANSDSGKGRAGKVIAIPMAVSHAPLPTAYGIQPLQQIVSGWMFAGKSIRSGHVQVCIGVSGSVARIQRDSWWCGISTYINRCLG
jgi:hypothetical protein